VFIKFRLGGSGSLRLQDTALNKFLVDLQLFNGDCTYGNGKSSTSKDQQRLLRGLVMSKYKAAEDLVEMRGKQPALWRSHLESACADN